MQDFRNTQHYISQINATPTPEEYYAEGYQLLRQCLSESQAVLRAPFTTSPPAAEGDAEAEREQLQRQVICCRPLCHCNQLIPSSQYPSRRQLSPFASATSLLACYSSPTMGECTKHNLTGALAGRFAKRCPAATRHDASYSKCADHPSEPASLTSIAGTRYHHRP